MVTTAPLRGCFPSDVHGIKYVRGTLPKDVFERLSEKVETASPEIKNKIWEALEKDLKDYHVMGGNKETTIKLTLRPFHINYP